jgi:hypothetical protein
VAISCLRGLHLCNFDHNLYPDVISLQLNYLQESYKELGINDKENAKGTKKPRKSKTKKTDSTNDQTETAETMDAE